MISNKQFDMCVSSFLSRKKILLLCLPKWNHLYQHYQRNLFFYIFRYLDTPTIVRSFRKVCKQFYTIVPLYDRFKFDFKSILESDFHLLCNFIQAKNVESLTLSDDDDETPGQIGYFLSIFRIPVVAK